MIWAKAFGAAMALAVVGCTHAKRVYVPRRCIQEVKWGRPCEAISESVIKCDGVMVKVSCVSVVGERSGAVESRKFAE